MSRIRRTGRGSILVGLMRSPVVTEDDNCGIKASTATVVRKMQALGQIPHFGVRLDPGPPPMGGVAYRQQTHHQRSALATLVGFAHPLADLPALIGWVEPTRWKSTRLNSSHT